MRKFTLMVLLFLCLLPAVRIDGKVAYAEAELSVRLPVIMYHSVLNSKQSKYIVSEKQLEADLAAIKSAGYTAVGVKEVVAYAEGKGFLPEKPILITFDDGHYNNMYYALPLLEKYGMQALFNIVGVFSQYSSSSGDKDNPNYSHLTWEEIGALYRGGRVCIGAHSYNMHKFKPRYGINKIYGESYEDYKKALVADTARLNEKLFEACGEYPIAYAYPFGKYSEDGRMILSEMGFKMFLTCNEGVSEIIFNNPNSLYTVKRVNRNGGYKTSDLLAKIA